MPEDFSRSTARSGEFGPQVVGLGEFCPVAVADLIELRNSGLMLGDDAILLAQLSLDRGKLGLGFAKVSLQTDKTDTIDQLMVTSLKRLDLLLDIVQPQIGIDDSGQRFDR